ncbi:MAG: T9SS type A sorting domain-containing protein [Candidatus Cloacimonetes bacterium]|nr:T9SS type A sorting domain-containing protein [Candidatus Cloacimonadota bacterium]
MRKYLVILILFITVGLSATILNVPEDYRYISLAIIASVDGDTVLVQPGTYNGVINFDGKAIMLTSTYLITGNEADIHHTVLGGSYSDASLISFINGEDASTILSGFTITNTGTPAQGGAIICDGTSPTLSHLRIVNNSATTGGAIYTNAASPVMLNCEISGNTGSDFGGAFYLEASTLSMTDCLLESNSCDGGGTLGRGGALFVSNSSINLSRCNFYNNNALVHAGGIYLSYGSADLFKCRFVGNTGGGNVGAVYFYKSTHMEVINCLFYNNTGTNAGSLRFFTDTAVTDVPTILNTICYGNSPCEIFFASDNLSFDVIVAYSDLQGGEDAIVTNNVANIVWLDGNIDAEPQFIAPEEGYYYLEEDSPCLDAGTAYFEYESIVYLDTEDFIGDSPDLGACETDPEDLPPLAMFSADVITGEAPLTVNFTDNSLGNTVTWNWDFDSDGIVDSEEQNPQWIYETADVFSVTLCVWSNSQSSVKTEVDLIEVTAPSAIDEQLPEPVQFMTVYPNPFNPSTTVSFSLESAEEIALQAYNIKGEFQEVLFKGALPAGEQNITWQPENLPSGIYLLRLQNGDKITTSKAILLK